MPYQSELNSLLQSATYCMYNYSIYKNKFQLFPTWNKIRTCLSLNKDNVKEFCKTISVYTVKSSRIIKEDLFKKQRGRNITSSSFCNDTMGQISNFHSFEMLLLYVNKKKKIKNKQTKRKKTKLNKV